MNFQKQTKQNPVVALQFDDIKVPDTDIKKSLDDLQRALIKAYCKVTYTMKEVSIINEALFTLYKFAEEAKVPKVEEIDEEVDEAN
jgi:hypothetical protein